MKFHPSPIAAALAASFGLLAGAAQAQSAVSISGFIDVGAYRGFDSKSQVGTIKRSNLAFSGAEDLGGGMLATFKLSHRFDIDTGTNEGAGSKPFWQGESSVGLKGAFGSVKLGRVLDAVWNNDWAFDPWENFDRIASPAWALWHYNYSSSRTSNNGSAEYGRLANGVFYDSPSFNGFSVHLSGSFEKTPNSTDGNNLGFSLNYDANGINLMGAHSKNASGDTVDFFGAAYKMGALRVMGSLDRSSYEMSPRDSKAKVWTLGATYDIGLLQLKGAYGHIDVDGATGSHTGLGVDYTLSKRTTVYLTTGRDKAPGASTTKSAYGVGVSHSF